MVREKDYFPVDIYAAKEYGIEKWQDEFFWPVSDNDFFELSEDVERCLARHINTEEIEIGKLLCFQYDLCFEYINYLHAAKVIHEAESRGLRISYSANMNWYSDIINKNPVAARLARIRKAVYGRSRYTLSCRAKDEAKKIVKEIIYNRNPLRLIKRAKDGNLPVSVYVVGNSLMREYIKKIPFWVNVASQRDWLMNGYPGGLSDGTKQKIDAASGAVVAGLKIIADSHKIPLGSEDFAYLLELTKNMLEDTALTSCLVRDSVRKNKKVHLLIGNLTNSFNRMLCSAIRDNGGKVTSFSHGFHIGLYNTPTLSLSDFAFADEFVTYTKKSCELFEKNRAAYSLIKDNNITISSADSDVLVKMRKKYEKETLPASVKSVMLIGYPLSQWRKPRAAAGFVLIQLDLELRLLDFLRENGYQVMYKMHPDSPAVVKEIFSGRAKIIEGYFEEAMGMADAFLFGSIRTTAFPVALCTNRPVIGMRMDKEPCETFSGPMEKLEKRCMFVNAVFDDKNRLDFDANGLLAALRKKPEYPNNDFIETYFFPDGKL